MPPKVAQNVRTRICPICKAKITNGKLAMKAHLAKHGPRPVAPSVLQAPASNKKRRNNKRPIINTGTSTSSDARVERGSDLVAIVKVDAPSEVGYIVASISITPRLFVDTRLSATAMLWNRWRPRMLKFSVSTDAGAMCTGAFCVGWTPQLKMVPTGTALVKAVSAMAPNSTQHVSNKVVLPIPNVMSHAWYRTSLTSEADELEHGTFLVVLSSAIGGMTGSLTFEIRLDYEIQFEGPLLPTDASGGGGSNIYADPSYCPYFTDSTGSWHADKLTLKERAGGWPVPFYTAKHDVVYKIDDKAELYYYKADGSKAEVKFGVRAKDWSSDATWPILALFEDETKAKDYAKTGDLSKVLTYTKAGDTISPMDNPAWFPQSSLVQAGFVLARPEPPRLESGTAAQLVKQLSAVLGRLAILESKVDPDEGAEDSDA